MKKKILTIFVSLFVLFVILISFGSSYTGLFYSPKIQDSKHSEIIEEEKVKWKMVGNVSVKLGEVSNLRG